MFELDSHTNVGASYNYTARHSHMSAHVLTITLTYRRSQVFHAKNISCAKISSYLIFMGGASHEIKYGSYIVLNFCARVPLA